MTTPLAIAVEVISPSSRSIDRLLKRELYEPVVTVWSLTGERYGEPRVVAGDERLALSGPLAVSVVPADLLR